MYLELFLAIVCISYLAMKKAFGLLLLRATTASLFVLKKGMPTWLITEIIIRRLNFTQRYNL